ncbi:MAG: hypothetical protein MUE47_01225 [Acidobacteria bacterium]|nr:hypothetical protein [Acidobacteriota bacterium]
MSEAHAAVDSASTVLRSRYGRAERARIERGVHQVLAFWRPADGSPDELRRFLEAEFLPRGAALDAAFARFEAALERIHGHLLALARDLRFPIDVDTGALTPLDERLATFDPFAHVDEDLFATKLAFVGLLNFPLTTLAERRAAGADWTRREWAEARLAEVLARRVPAEVAQQMTRALVAADTYVNGYDIHAHGLVDAAGRRPFPAGLRLISHWGLRDEIKARYADPDGLPAQRLLQRALERIVAQEIPAAVPGNAAVDWNPFTNEIRPRPAAAATPAPDREPDTRYAHWLACFHAARAADAHDPAHPTFLARRFDRDRELAPEEVETLLVAVLEAPVGARVAALIARRLGRPLEPFDIWYAGFKPGAAVDEAELDRLVRGLYPRAEDFAAAVPTLLERLGFAPDRAQFIAARLAVDPARGAGHAMPAGMREDRARLRTRIGADGMDYKSLNVAMHELGHNVEQVFSLAAIDHTLLAGVPNVAFTEAFAFLFQGKDLGLLGHAGGDDDARDRRALDLFWNVREIAGVAMVDIAAWRWLYEHPEATPAELREAVGTLARATWNRWFAPWLGRRDALLLAVYSHAISHPLYLPDYPLGHLVCFQIEEHFRRVAGEPQAFGREVERLTTLGRLTPEAWMRAAVGGPVSAAPLIAAAEAAATEREALEGPGPGSGAAPRA